jgi:hypothetical protein
VQVVGRPGNSREHRQTALRLRLGCFVLQNVPVFGQQTVGHADDIGGDPILRSSSVRERVMDDHVIAFATIVPGSYRNTAGELRIRSNRPLRPELICALCWM